jgi:predicted lipid-binding transport protein (Tim44 family)
MFRPRWLSAFIAIAAAFVLVTADAHARAGGGFSGGSRGMRTFSAPPSTPTAPTAAPIQNSMTQPSTAPIGQTGARPGLFGGRGFGSGLLGGIAAGFLGAGLFGLLFGQGFFGGMAGFASIIGLLLQVVLVLVVARLIFAWWQRRNASTPAYAAARPATGYNFGGFGRMLGGTASPGAGAPLPIAKSNYDAFERLLGEIQAAYSTEDLSALRAKVTPEMLSYFSEQLAGNASRGLVNRVTDVKLLQGDLAEAWRECDRLCDRRHEIRSQGQYGRTRQWTHRRRRRAERSYRIVDLHARARRQLAALCHPADLMPDSTGSVMGLLCSSGPQLG